MSDISDRLRAMLAALEAVRSIGRTGDDCDPIYEQASKALAEFPDPDAVGECVDLCREEADLLCECIQAEAKTCSPCRADIALAKLLDKP